MFRPISKLLLATLLLLCSPAGFAELADRNKPIHLEADQVLMDDAQQVSTFTGNVQLAQGTMLIRGDKIVVVQDKDGFKHATAYGKPSSFRQKREGLDEYVEAYGERIEYDTRNDTLNLYTQALLKRNKDEVRGEHITYNAKTEIFQVGSSGASPGDAPPQRVRAVLQPKSKEAKAPPPPAPETIPAIPSKSLTHPE
jgi:lipopolysaccharide export system protein LptA